jgi:hypothetical protein
MRQDDPDNDGKATRRLVEGMVFDKVLLETCRDTGMSRPRVRPVSHFPASTRVWFPRDLRENYPVGTRFYATVKVSRKHYANGEPKGPPYLSASSIGVIVSSIPDPGLRARIRRDGRSGRAYDYVWD